MDTKIPLASEFIFETPDGSKWDVILIKFAKLHAIEIIKKLSKTEEEFQHNINYVYPLSNIK